MKKAALSHYNAAGDVALVDVSAKNVTARTAIARAFVAMSTEVLQTLPANKKGDPLQVARIAGIAAAKKTSELIPLCHQIPPQPHRPGVQARCRRHSNHGNSSAPPLKLASKWKP